MTIRRSSASSSFTAGCSSRPLGSHRRDCRCIADQGTSSMSFMTLAVLAQILALKQADSEPYSPVGWSKCSDCGFQGRCWPQAEAKGDVAMVEGVD